MRLSVMIPTYNRPDCIRRCLACLAQQVPPPDQVIVVDAATNDLTREAVAEFPGVEYVANPAGRRNTPNSRNVAVRRSTGDIIASLDDDAYAHPGWVAAILKTYRDPTIAGVAGRALNNQPGEATRGLDEIGKLRRNGTVSGNFAADPGRIVEVDHMIGCNMSFRRE